MSPDAKPTESSLYRKLAEVVAEVGYVAKDGKNEFQNYRYASAEALLAAIRGPLSARSVVLMPSVTDIGEREYTTSKGKASVITTVRVTFTMVDGESGEMHRCDWAGQGDDPGDKGLGKAYTNAIKTFLREQFLIPTGDDPEADSKTDERAADRASARPKTQANGNAEPPRLASKSDVREITEATKGLTGSQIKLALAACGVPAVDFYEEVPADKVVPLIQKLVLEREKQAAKA